MAQSGASLGGSSSKTTITIVVLIIVIVAAIVFAFMAFKGGKKPVTPVRTESLPPGQLASPETVGEAPQKGTAPPRGE